jgi:acetyl-CoA acetyltransferase
MEEERFSAAYRAGANAYLRKPITLDDYKKSRLISDPIRLFDCVMPANGGKAGMDGLTAMHALILTPRLGSARTSACPKTVLYK